MEEEMIILKIETSETTGLVDSLITNESLQDFILGTDSMIWTEFKESLEALKKEERLKLLISLNLCRTEIVFRKRS